MVVVSTVVPLLHTPTWGAVFAVAVLLPATVAGAALVGRRIRKNGRLQLALSAIVGAQAAPIVFWGGGSWEQAAKLGVSLAVVFVAGVGSVRAILQRRCRRHDAAIGWSVVSISAPLTLALILAGGGDSLEALALGLVSLYGLCLLLWQPDARRLKQIGISLATLQVLAGLLLVI